MKEKTKEVNNAEVTNSDRAGQPLLCDRWKAENKYINIKWDQFYWLCNHSELLTYSIGKTPDIALNKMYENIETLYKEYKSEDKNTYSKDWQKRLGRLQPSNVT